VTSLIPVGRRKVFLAGVSTFTTFALISSFMKSDVGFFICRAITGMGSAMMNASNAGKLHLSRVLRSSADLSMPGLIVENIKPGRTRSLLISISSSGVAVGNALGAGIAGPLVEATQSVRRISIVVTKSFS
jgi:MFS family permease